MWIWIRIQDTKDPKKMPTKSPSWHPTPTTPTAPATWHGQNGKGDQQDQLFGILRKMVKHGEFPWKKMLEKISFNH